LSSEIKLLHYYLKSIYLFKDEIVIEFSSSRFAMNIFCGISVINSSINKFNFFYPTERRIVKRSFKFNVYRFSSISTLFEDINRRKILFRSVVMFGFDNFDKCKFSDSSTSTYKFLSRFIRNIFNKKIMGYKLEILKR
jgi:hypothetical protein